MKKDLPKTRNNWIIRDINSNKYVWENPRGRFGFLNWTKNKSRAEKFHPSSAKYLAKFWGKSVNKILVAEKAD